MAQTPSPVTVAAKQTYKASFDRTSMKNVDGKSLNVCDTFTSPEDSEFVKLVNEGKRGYLTVKTVEGEFVMGKETSAQAAQATMRACRDGKFNPYPPVNITKKQDIGSPQPVKAGV